MRDETLAVHAGYETDPTTKSVVRAHLPDGGLRVRRRPARRRPLQPRGRGQHLHAHHEPHRGRAREARRGDGGRHRRPGPVGRLCGHQLRHPDHRQGRRQHRLGAAALRRHLHALRAHAARARASTSASPRTTAPRRSRSSSTTRPRPSSSSPSATPPATSPTSKAIADDGPQPRRPGHRRLHGLHARADQAHRVGRGHRHPLHDQVHRRPRQLARRHDRRQRQLPLGRARRPLPMLIEPEPAYHGVSYTETFGPAAFIARARTVPLRNTGSAISPLNAFLILQGIQTLPIRMERHVENAKAVAKHLQDHPQVEWVSYAGLPDSPYYELAQKYTGGKPSGPAQLRGQGRLRARRQVLRRAQALQAPGQHRRRALAGGTPGLDHASPDDARGAGHGRRHARPHPPVRRHRAHRRHHRGPRPGPGSLASGEPRTTPRLESLGRGSRFPAPGQATSRLHLRDNGHSSRSRYWFWPRTRCRLPCSRLEASAAR